MKYIDLDGVLADLDSWLRTIDIEGVEKEEAFNRIAIEHYDRIFAESSPIIENFRLLEGDYRILTTLPHPQNYFRYGAKFGLKIDEIAKRRIQMYKNKLEWCVAHNIPRENVIIVEARKLKQCFCVPGDFLYDDSRQTIKEWDFAGGIGVLMEPSH